MRIAVVGTGRMGLALGRRLAAAGHDVRLGSRDPERGREKAAAIGAAFGGGCASAALGADAVLLAVPWQAVPQTLALLGDLRDAILIDVTNPFREGTSAEQDVFPGSSGAEQIQALLPGVPVVKAFNHVYSGVLRSSPLFDGERATVFVAGDDPAARDAVCGLVRDLGYEPASAGPLASARYLEPLAALMTALDRGSGGTSVHALKLLTRERGRATQQARARPLEGAVG
jgi:8-hydroxy-5-deazaflavin:NADPH oxidoreductase